MLLSRRHTVELTWGESVAENEWRVCKIVALFAWVSLLLQLLAQWFTWGIELPQRRNSCSVKQAGYGPTEARGRPAEGEGHELTQLEASRSRWQTRIERILFPR